jgi:hypothetical protein
MSATTMIGPPICLREGEPLPPYLAPVELTREDLEDFKRRDGCNSPTMQDAFRFAQLVNSLDSVLTPKDRDVYREAVKLSKDPQATERDQHICRAVIEKIEQKVLGATEGQKEKAEKWRKSKGVSVSGLRKLVRGQPVRLTSDGLSVGAHVKIHSLKAAPQYNALKGVINVFDASQGRWGVQIAAGKIVSVKPQNLELISRQGVIIDHVGRSWKISHSSDKEENVMVHFADTLADEWVRRDLLRTHCANGCGEEAMLRCAKCGTVYCCSECQKSHWTTHKPTCKKLRE